METNGDSEGKENTGDKPREPPNLNHEEQEKLNDKLLAACELPADALTKIDGKYPYGNVKFIKETCLAGLVILILGIGFFLADFGTDLQFSIEMSSMSNQSFTEEINDCTRDIQVTKVTVRLI